MTNNGNFCTIEFKDVPRLSRRAEAQKCLCLLPLNPQGSMVGVQMRSGSHGITAGRHGAYIGWQSPVGPHGGSIGMHSSVVSLLIESLTMFIIMETLVSSNINPSFCNWYAAKHLRVHLRNSKIAPFTSQYPAHGLQRGQICGSGGNPITASIVALCVDYKIFREHGQFDIHRSDPDVMIRNSNITMLLTIMIFTDCRS